MANAIALPMANATVGQPAMRHAAVDLHESRFSEDIAHPANGVNQGMLRADVYFVP
jgi:hypothetical protein